MRSAVFVLLSACVLLLTGCKNASDLETEKTCFAMDTAVTVKGSASDTELVCDEMRRLDSLFDRYSENSDIYAVNNRLNKEISLETCELIRQSAALTEKYGSSVNIFSGSLTDCWNINASEPTVPDADKIFEALEEIRLADFSLDSMKFMNGCGSIDVGSTAKGYALDCIEKKLGEQCCIVSMTSSILLHGKKPDGKPFNIAVRDPENAGKSIGSINTGECFLSTSGGYERYFEADGEKYIHIFDLESGYPSDTDLTSVTVLCGSGIKSDFLSTLIFLEGSENLGKYLEYDDIRFLAVTKDKEIFVSDDMDFTLEKGSGYTVGEWNNE